jgi:hypothetical protein
MKIKIENPYTESNSMVAFKRGVDAAFTELKPKRFADELPEKGQSIIVYGTIFSRDVRFNPDRLTDGHSHIDGEKIITKNKYYAEYYMYSHWSPFPKLE